MFSRARHEQSSAQNVWAKLNVCATGRRSHSQLQIWSSIGTRTGNLLYLPPPKPIRTTEKFIARVENLRALVTLQVRQLH